MIQKELFLETLGKTEKLAIQIARHCQVGDVVLLQGDLGVGKTAFAKFFINTLLDKKEDVPSPTFTLLQTFDAKDFPIWHFDLYRLKHDEEAYELGIEDAFAEGVSLIEWPEIIASLVPETTLSISLSYGTNEEERSALLQGNHHWKSFIESITI